jgi:hypothetical protein
MLRIRAEQMRAFERHRTSLFREKLLRHLKEVVPECASPQAQIERGMASAGEFGLVSEKHVAQFVEITCRHLGKFPEGRLPVPALTILMAHGVDPAAKLERYSKWAESDGRNVQ